jgi:hypothetical protein
MIVPVVFITWPMPLISYLPSFQISRIHLNPTTVQVKLTLGSMRVALLQEH